MHIVTMLIALLVFSSASYAAQGEIATLYIPNDGETYVPLEIVAPAQNAPQDAKKAIRELKANLKGIFHVAGKKDTKEIHAKCTVREHHIEAKDIPSYRMWCWSIVPLRADSLYQKIGEAPTMEGVLEFNKKFSQEHQKRLKLPRTPSPMKNGPLPSFGRVLYT